MHPRTPIHLDGLEEAGALTEAAVRAAEESAQPRWAAVARRVMAKVAALTAITTGSRP
ncbi:hypothetical protein [Streptomyces sp. NPDC001530]|uniref:hypothetical protein n=1 Tax=Streptomyces sp. NPDC001530 TaxID=3364582 RepID=UPI0036D15CFA